MSDSNSEPTWPDDKEQFPVFGSVQRSLDAARERNSELERALEQACRDINQAHDELMKAQGADDPSAMDWPEWTPQANTIRWAEQLLGKRLAKTTLWTTVREPDQGAEQ